MKKYLLIMATVLFGVGLFSGFTLNVGNIWEDRAVVYWESQGTNVRHVIYVDNKPTEVNYLNSKTDGKSISYTAKWMDTNIDHYIRVVAHGLTYPASSQNVTITPYSSKVQYTAILDVPYGYGTDVARPLIVSVGGGGTVDVTGSTVGSRTLDGSGTEITSTNILGRDALDVHASQAGTWNTESEITNVADFSLNTYIVQSIQSGTWVVDTKGTTITNVTDFTTNTYVSQITNVTDFTTNTYVSQITNVSDFDTLTLGSRTLDGDGNAIGSVQTHGGGRGLLTTSTLYSPSGNAIASNFWGLDKWSFWSSSAQYGFWDIGGVFQNNLLPFGGIKLDVSPTAKGADAPDMLGLINLPYHWTGSEYVQSSVDHPQPVSVNSSDIATAIANQFRIDANGTTLAVGIMGWPSEWTDVGSGTGLNVQAESGRPIPVSIMANAVDSSVNTFIANINLIGGSIITNPNYVTWTADSSDLTVTAVAVHGLPEDVYAGLTDTAATIRAWQAAGFPSDVTITATGTLPTYLIDSTGATAVAVDTYGALVTIPMEHHKVHQGLNFIATKKFTNIDTAGKSIRLTHPTKNLHIKWSMSADVETWGFLYEGGEFGPASATITAQNRNRTSAVLSETDVIIHEDSLIVPDETVTLWSSVMGASGVGDSRGSGDASASEEIETKAGVDYYFYVSPTNATNDISLEIDFYSRD